MKLTVSDPKGSKSGVLEGEGRKFIVDQEIRTFVTKNGRDSLKNGTTTTLSLWYRKTSYDSNIHNIVSLLGVRLIKMLG